MKVLVEEKNANIQDGFALSIAIKSQNFEAIQFLVESGGKLNSKTKRAAASGWIGSSPWEVVKFLVKVGAVPDNEYTEGC